MIWERDTAAGAKGEERNHAPEEEYFKGSGSGNPSVLYLL